MIKYLNRISYSQFCCHLDLTNSNLYYANREIGIRHHESHNSLYFPSLENQRISPNFKPGFAKVVHKAKKRNSLRNRKRLQI